MWMRVYALTFAAPLMSFQASAAATSIGPATIQCSNLSAQKMPDMAVGLMWIIGFVDGANRTSPNDILVGRKIDDVVDLVEAYCLSNPSKNLADAATNTIEKLKFEHGQK